MLDLFSYPKIKTGTGCFDYSNDHADISLKNSCDSEK